MPSLLNRYATPLITGLFLVSLISGIALFFHWGSNWFHSMHVWLSMVLIVPFVLHIWRNWRPMTCYFKRAPMAIAMAVSLVAALAFVVPQIGASSSRGARGGPPQFALAQKLLDAPLESAAPILGLSAQALGTKLTQAGYTVRDTSARLSDIATTSGKSSAALANLLSAP